MIKIKYNRFIFALLILSYLFVAPLFFVHFAYAQVSDTNYIFEENLLYNQNNPTPDMVQNSRYEVNYTGHFNASYSYEDQVGETGSNIDGVYSGADTEVIVSYNNHSEVIEFDTSGASTWIAEREGLEQTSGTIEWWHRFDNSNPNLYIYLMGDADQRQRFRTDYLDVLKYQHTSEFTYTTFINPYSPNIWHHCRVDWFSNAKYDFYYNGEKVLDQKDLYYGLGDGINNIKFYENDATVDHYFDGMGYSWLSNYTINDNIVPYHYNTSVSEVDKWEFDSNEDGSKTVDGQDAVPFITEIGTTSKTTIERDIWYLADSYDGAVCESEIQNTEHRGIYKTIDVASADIIGVYINYIASGYFEEETFYSDIKIYSYDNTLLVCYRITDFYATQGDLRLYHYDGTSYNEIENLANGYHQVEINVTIVDNIVYAVINSVDYIYNILTENKDGLADVKIESWFSDVEDDRRWVGIDSIGVYINGSSESNDYASHYYATNRSYNPKYHNLVSINSTGVFGLSVVSFIQTFVSDIFGIINTSTLSFLNTYNHAEVNIAGAYLSISTQSNFTLNSLYIYGVQIDDGTNEIEATYSYGNININSSYWYISAVDTLSYILIADDSNTEYIQIEFDIVNSITYQRNFIYTSSNFNVFGKELRLNYLDSTTTILNMTYGFRSERVYLASDKIFIDFDILITDDDLYTSYNSTGYFTDFILRASSSHDISITTSNLLTALTPLLFVILLPSFIITYSFKKVGKDDDLRGKVLLPVVTIFTIVAFWFAEIELWMFFLMILGFGVLFYLQRD